MGAGARILRVAAVQMESRDGAVEENLGCAGEEREAVCLLLLSAAILSRCGTESKHECESESRGRAP
jgi:hypothetical protein